MDSNIIEFKNVAYKYPKSNFNISINHLSLNKGEITLFTGRNGSGKTTISKLCCGIINCDSGEILIKGEDIKNLSLGGIGKTIGYLFQEPSKQLFTSNVWEEMTFVAGINNIDKNETEEKAINLLKKFNLYDLKERSIYHLSRGEKQRLAIAAILMQNIEYFILDEPTTGLDKENRTAFYDVVDELVKNGIGIAIISHDNEVIKRYNFNRIIIDEGRVLNEKI